MTGMSEELRSDFNVKKDLDSHTRLSPKQRCEQLMHLIQSIRENPEALKQIKNWGLELDDSLTRVSS
jgi:aubergine-like protein